MSDLPRIILVDDEEPILRSLKRLLAFEPYELVTCNNADEALQAVNQAAPAVIVSDQHMPGMQGVDLLRAVRDQCPNCSRILFSGHIDVELLRQAVNNGEVYRFITKPWNDDELLLAIRLGVERWQLRSENDNLHQQSMKQNEQLQTFNASLEAMVTERTQALQMRNNALLLNQEILDHLPIVVIGIDPDDQIVLCNALARELFVYIILGDPAGAGLPAAVHEWLQNANRPEQCVLKTERLHLMFEIASLDERGFVIVGHPQGATHESF